ncbi:hypothetical protein SteCoe_8745 [Stentor coeruleus]|uniref:Uncharacterized protein n=1 Tax=Stentor coeruleus TaxID=5963 RepID=A0A1R2CJJ1_9CILI|nr:hypothetical protein SteCoe_8745 [Stentor coeruleus]
MQSKKYTLKKDSKTIVVKMSKQLPIIKASPKSKINFELYKGTSLISTRSSNKVKVSKSLNTLNRIEKTGTKSFIRRSPFDTSLLASVPRNPINYNIRYLKEDSTQLDDKNIIETPSDSLKPSDQDNKLPHIIANEYENYLLYNIFLPAISSTKKRSITSNRENSKQENDVSKLFSDTPPNCSPYILRIIQKSNAKKAINQDIHK